MPVGKTSNNLTNVVAGMPASAADWNALVASVAFAGFPAQGEFQASGRGRQGSESARRFSNIDTRFFFNATTNQNFIDHSVMGITIGSTVTNGQPDCQVHAADDGDILVTNDVVELATGDSASVTLIGTDRPTRVRLSDASTAGDEVGPLSDGTVDGTGTGLILLTGADVDSFAWAVKSTVAPRKLVRATQQGPMKAFQGQVYKITNSTPITAGTTITVAAVSPVQTIVCVNPRPNWVDTGILYIVRKIGKFWVVENDACFQDFMV